MEQQVLLAQCNSGSKP